MSITSTIVVNTTADELITDGNCSLREAVQAANTNTAVDACAAGNGDDIISLPAGIYTLTLSGAGEDNNATGDLDILDTVTISGADPATTIIDANGLDRALHLVNDGATLTLTNVTVRNGQVSQNLESGGGLYASGFAVLTNVTFAGNTASSGNGGGAYFAKPAVLTTARFQGNTALGNLATSGQGGGAYFGGSAVITGSLFVSNTAYFGGGTYFYESAAITRSTFLSNTVSEGGGGAHFESELVPSRVSVAGTTFQGNRAGPIAAGPVRPLDPQRPTGSSAVCEGGRGGGGAVFDGSANITNTTFVDNAASCGGGAYFYSKNFEINLVNLTNTFFLKNIAEDGGGVFLQSFGVDVDDFVNTLFAANKAIHDQGSVLYSNDAGGNNIVTLRHATIASPTLATGSAVYVLSGTVNITNTIVASYTTGLERAGGVLNENYNLFFGTANPISGSVNSGANGVLGGDPAFANPSNADYHLTSNSAAVNGGTNAGVTFDFENEVRPQQYYYDIGYDESPYTQIPLGNLNAINSSPTAVNKTTFFTATLTSGSGVHYQWNFGDGTSVVSAPRTVNHIYTKVGNFTAIVTATNGLGSTSATTPVVITWIKTYLPILIK